MRLTVIIVLAVMVVLVIFWQGPAITRLVNDSWLKLTKTSDQAIQQSQLETVNLWDRQIVNKNTVTSQLAKNLPDDVKQAIDIWLEAKKLNQYGDPKETVYAGGTPLFDEKTGVSKDRFEYLLEKFPGLIKEFKLETLLKK